ncbi:DUF2442 domain-containing protein [Phyllobacterium zundukense]|uniref:DUF2442 domain-containing protein n=1 Tax=Phyllobacterium zundukense TaxID=1867719 RepID=UPI0019519759|nr:DUF2442 domain-containing protein [Phyllobacterium zundukense]
MNSLVKAEAVRFDDDSMWLELSDGRTLGVPLVWFPRLLHATAEQRSNVRISSRGLHWETLDEDISVACWLVMATRPNRATPQKQRSRANCCNLAAPKFEKRMLKKQALGVRERFTYKRSSGNEDREVLE